ncbi:MAG: 30S ribosomal protein S12 methylthiotransferase RimO [Pirellulaceae bacterium]
MDPKSLPIIQQSPSCSQPSLEQIERSGVKGRYAFVSLGCPKNLVDSEKMLGVLQQDGYQLTADVEGSDFVVINTCAFIDSARKESMSAIDQMLELKKQGKIKGVLVSGCLAERQREALLQARPEIDGLIGVFGREEISHMADRILGGIEEQRTVFRPAPIRALPDDHRVRVTPRHFAYLKISEGCDRLCTFCAIPKMRGKHASKPMPLILDEAKELIASGVRELIVVAQDTTYYGIDSHGQSQLRILLEQLDQLEGLDWIRLMYFYPMHIDQPLIDSIASAKHIVPYIDIPLQHINDTMLRRMSRRVDRSQTEALLEKLRAGIPNLVLRTTFIAGFPGETDEQFEELAEFIEKTRFERLGVFTYSLEPDTPAAKLDGHLPERIKKERRNHLMAIQQQQAFEFCDSRLGSRQEVLIDRQVDAQKGIWAGRSKADAPDVDALVYVTAQPEQKVTTGSLVTCEIVGHEQYDALAVPIAEAR